jgi:hypothetical protein
MARRTPTLEPQPANLSPQQIKQALPKLQRRLRELEEVRIERWDDNVGRDLDALQTKVEETLAQVFGHGALEHKRYRMRDFGATIPLFVNHQTTPREYIEG